LWHDGGMRILLAGVLAAVLVLGVFSAPVAAYDCSISCPVGLQIGDLNVVSTCVPKDTPTNPTWCDENYTGGHTGTCPSDCGPIMWNVLVCEIQTKTRVVFPYDTYNECVRVAAYDEVPCCDEIKPAACQGACGIATCSIGDCVNNKCVNPSCPSDADCVCDEEPGHRLSLAITNLM